MGVLRAGRLTLFLCALAGLLFALPALLASPQYLFPVRRSVFRALEQRFPLYGDLEELSAGAETRPFLLGAGSRPWLRTIGADIKRQVFARQ